MNIIMPKKSGGSTRRTIFTRSGRFLFVSKRARRFIAVFVLCFAFANVVVYGIYSGRTYANTSIAGHHLGSVKREDLAGKIDSMHLLPKDFTLTQGEVSVKIIVADLGIGQDAASTAERAMRTRTWFPLANLFISHDVPLQVAVDQSALQTKIQEKITTINKPATDAKIAKQGESFAIKSESAGVTLDVKKTTESLLQSIQSGKSNVPIATMQVVPKVTAKELQPKLATIQEQVKTSITLQYDGQSKKFSAADISAFYTEETEGTRSNLGVTLSDIAIQNSVITTGSSFGIGVQNLTEATAAIKSAISEKKDLTFKLTARPFGKVYYYCTGVRGVSESELPALAAQIKTAFSDSRGWNLGGLVKFQYVNTGCDFTVWLAAADQMATFGEICDPEWSCAVPPNVIINYDRWRYTTAPWKQYGGSLEDYRIMAINHETGHWLGFYHDHCPGAGQPAPLMQQQSVDLQGCVFNPWPTANEQAVFRQRLGL